MTKDSEKGLGGLLAYEHPETKARRISELNKQIRGTVTPLSDIDIDVFSSLPLATEVNLEANTKVTPSVAPPEPKRKRPTKGQIYRGAMEHFARPKLTEQEKEFWGAWNNSEKMLKYVKKHTDAYAGDEERFNGRIQEQDRISVSNNKVKGLGLSSISSSPRNEIADRKPKILSTPIGDVKIINSTNQKDIAKNNPRRKI